MSDFAFENGKEVLWYCEHYQTKRIFFTSPLSPVPPGYIRHCTKNPKEMDHIFNRMHEQEREQNEKLIEAIYSRGREHYDTLRSALRNRLVSAGVSDAEKNIIRASLKLMDERDHKMQQNTVYGVSDMQEKERPIEAPRTRIM